MRKRGLTVAALFLLVFVSVAGFHGSSASAKSANPISDSCHQPLLGIPTWYEYLEVGPKGDDKCAIIGPADPADAKQLDIKKVVPRVVMAIVDIMLRLAALIALAFVIYGGFRYTLSQGEPDATKKAKGTIISASVGLAITMFAATIVGFVGNILWK